MTIEPVPTNLRPTSPMGDELKSRQNGPVYLQLQGAESMLVNLFPMSRSRTCEAYNWIGIRIGMRK